MATIHPTALVDPAAQIAASASIGPFTIVHADVRIGDDTTIGAHCLIDNGARIGNRVRIHQGTVVATPPQDLKYAGEPTEFFIGNDTEIREYCTLNRGTTHSYKSTVGSNCLLMAYVHVAHDCQVGNNVILANGVQMGGHTVIGDHAIIGGLTGIHQFSHIGAHAMLAAGIKIAKDCPPYALIGGSPGMFEGVNRIGLKRRGFSPETIDLIAQTYKALYHSGMNVSQAVEHIREHIALVPEVQSILDFIATSTRGIVKKAG